MNKIKRNSTQKRKERRNLEDAIELLRSINKNLEDIKNKESLPKLIYAKEIAEKYKVNKNKATEFCKRYGTNFGGYCIEADKFKEVLQNEGLKIFERS